MIDVPGIILQWRLKMTLAGCILQLMMWVLVRIKVIPSSRIFCTLTLIAVFFFAIFEHCSLRVYNDMQTM